MKHYANMQYACEMHESTDGDGFLTKLYWPYTTRLNRLLSSFPPTTDITGTMVIAAGDFSPRVFRNVETGEIIGQE